MPTNNKNTVTNSQNENEEKKEETPTQKTNRKLLNRALQTINNLLGQSNQDLYGSDRNSDVSSLDKQFNHILHDTLSKITNTNNEDITSFINRLYASDKKSTTLDELMKNQFSGASIGNLEALKSTFFEIYKNRIIKQADIHEVASQLIELSEAILVTRDAIISADVVEGRLNRALKFGTDTDNEDAVSVTEIMEKKFDTLNKIKSFIIPDTLEFGEYYIYTIPYSKVFSDFEKSKLGKKHFFRESVLTESFSDSEKKKDDPKEYDSYLNSFYDKFISESSQDSMDAFNRKMPSKSEFKKDMTKLFEHVSVCNDEVPIPFMEEGVDGIEKFMSIFTEKENSSNKMEMPVNLFKRVNSTDQSDASEGIKVDGWKNDKEFSEIKDCYVRLLEPMRVLPVKILDFTIGYYYIMEEKINPIGGSVSNSVYFSDNNSKEMSKTIINGIADRIVKSFDKKFLMDNLKFKKEIADAISFYNLNHAKLKFQFIPVEYMSIFKIDEDEEGNGRSMISRSLFYAKLYLMLLLFRLLSIFLYSNDQKVNYVKQSGIDKSIQNKIEELMRIQQNRKINIMDLFTYTTLINKIGAGNEMYIPVGRTGDRPVETEILSGQDIQPNSDLLEMLKNSYILATGVPATIINYLSEPEFATQVQQSNTKWNGRIINYQLDLNKSITDWYKKLMRWSTDLPDNVIESFNFVLQPPKTVSSNTRSDAIQTFTNLQQFLVELLFDDPQQSTDPELPLKIREFKKLLVKDQLPLINMTRIEELVSEAELTVKEIKLRPNPLNGDDDEDIDDSLLDNNG